MRYRVFMRKFLDRLTFERGVQLLVLLNLVDAASTHILLKLGYAVETNPILAWAYAVGPELFWVVKMGLVTGGLMAIGRLASEAVAKSVVVSANLLYLVVLLIHLSGWLDVLR